MVHMNSGGKLLVTVCTKKGQKFFRPCYCCAPIPVGGGFDENHAGKDPVEKLGRVEASRGEDDGRATGESGCR